MSNKDGLQPWERRCRHSGKCHSTLRLSLTSVSLLISLNARPRRNQNSISFQYLLAWFVPLHGFRIRDLLNQTDTHNTQVSEG